MVSKVRSLIDILILTLEKLIVIVSISVAYLIFVKGFVYISMPTPFYYLLAIFSLVLTVLTKKKITAMATIIFSSLLPH
jgi:hypothetical protein